VPAARFPADKQKKTSCLVETIAVLQNRLGMDAMTVFQNDVRPILIILWVDEDLH